MVVISFAHFIARNLMVCNRKPLSSIRGEGSTIFKWNSHLESPWQVDPLSCIVPQCTLLYYFTLSNGRQFYSYGDSSAGIEWVNNH
jgi:hypothetical protein